MATAERQFAEARRQMVLTQLRPNKVIDEQVIDAMAALPREQFVPKTYRGVAYMDEDVAVAPGRYLMEPMVLARLLQEAEIQPAEVALVVGAATGYEVAVLARLTSTVIGLESDATLSQLAGQTLQALGIDNTALVEGALKDGLAKQGPFNIILLAGAVPEISPALLDQLADGGRLIGVLRAPEAPIGQAVLIKRAGNLFPQRVLFDAGTPVLPGFERPAAFVF
ncbi:MAG: protein-L-isoaspartate O-methyltransferase [Ferrovibrio sp.]|uniref:protein-L-isoaspartate O-methyltransferase family protein n=1 Tax=Ferrovibrio sp. TaxID=1917215 RepID=UPI0026099FAE|nr:protein-L-isoaspartate O-methyltransferase [Ferrovibrio sp.]MCW0233167.1 protein-L-isoaspartate O-methyltransferase [Ferrovibrio sp.]